MKTRTFLALLLLLHPLATFACGEDEAACSDALALYVVLPSYLIGIVAAIVLFAMKKFRQPVWFYSYCVALVILVAGSPFACTSLELEHRVAGSLIFFGLLIPLLAPAIFQYIKARLSGTP